MVNMEQSHLWEVSSSFTASRQQSRFGVLFLHASGSHCLQNNNVHLCGAFFIPECCISSGCFCQQLFKRQIVAAVSHYTELRGGSREESCIHWGKRWKKPDCDDNGWKWASIGTLIWSLPSADWRMQMQVTAQVASTLWLPLARKQQIRCPGNKGQDL